MNRQRALAQKSPALCGESLALVKVRLKMLHRERRLVEKAIRTLTEVSKVRGFRTGGTGRYRTGN
jgi:hypothetical protein